MPASPDSVQTLQCFSWPKQKEKLVIMIYWLQVISSNSQWNCKTPPRRVNSAPSHGASNEQLRSVEEKGQRPHAVSGFIRGSVWLRSSATLMTLPETSNLSLTWSPRCQAMSSSLATPTRCSWTGSKTASTIKPLSRNTTILPNWPSTFLATSTWVCA